MSVNLNVRLSVRLFKNWKNTNATSDNPPYHLNLLIIFPPAHNKILLWYNGYGVMMQVVMIVVRFTVTKYYRKSLQLSSGAAIATSTHYKRMI